MASIFWPDGTTSCVLRNLDVYPIPGFQGVGHVAYGEDVEAVTGAMRPRDLEESGRGARRMTRR